MRAVRWRSAGGVCACATAVSLCAGVGAFFTSPLAARAAAARRTTRLKGVREWREGQPGELRDLGFLPFPVEDVMCPGETKALHLYEARFLSLFENAINHHGGCVGGAIFVKDGLLVRVGQLCDIVAWEREEVGVSLAIRCIGRCEISDVTGVDPYIRANVREVRDVVGVDEPDEEGEGNETVSSDVFILHRQCVELEGKMAAAAGGNIGWEALSGKIGAESESSGPFNMEEEGENEEENEKEEEENDDDEAEDGSKKKGLRDLMWGHESHESNGFDSSLEDQVEAMYDSLKADLSVSLEENRGGSDAVAFGAPDNKRSKRGGGRDRPWGARDGSEPKTIADVIVAAAAASGGSLPAAAACGEEDGGDGQFLWGCASAKEERQQLLSFVSLGCFGPPARLQSMMLLSTGERLRMAKDALAERLKVLVAKSALSQLGD